LVNLSRSFSRRFWFCSSIVAFAGTSTVVFGAEEVGSGRVVVVFGSVEDMFGVVWWVERRRMEEVECWEEDIDMVGVVDVVVRWCCYAMFCEYSNGFRLRGFVLNGVDMGCYAPILADFIYRVVCNPFPAATMP